MQRKLRARKKRQIGTQVKFDSTKTINHQQTHVCSFEYTIIRKWLKQPLFLCYNKKYFILIHPLSSENTFSLHSKTKGSILFMKTLYVSDLDGTLLRKNETLSTYTIKTINTLTASGMLFSYATARSLNTAKKVTEGLNTHFPLIIYNGAFVKDNITEEILIANYFEEDVYEVLKDLFAHEIYPIIYSYQNNIEKFSYIPEKATSGMQAFLNSRRGDKRTNIVTAESELMDGNLFYITCIDKPEKLEPFYHKYKNKYHVVYQKDIYTGEQWLEIMPQKASKAQAALQLKQKLECDRLVVFGDGKNDIDMFEIADEAYAVENAVSELKVVATGIIESNENDGVAKYLHKIPISKPTIL